MDACSIKNHSEAISYLDLHFKDSSEEALSDILDCATVKWKDVDVMEKEVLGKIEEIVEKFQKTGQGGDTLRLALECRILHELHDNIMINLYNQFMEEDSYIFEKSKRLDKKAVTAEDLGALGQYDIYLPASIVELASLDSHRCPLEKLNCLGTTYDLIFAELKTAIVEVIANSTDANEHDIPIVNNSDIKPVLMGVIVKAKLKHLYTNLYYMQIFGSVYSQQFNHVLEAFQVAVQGIVDLEESSIRTGSGKLRKEIDLMEFSAMSLEEKGGRVETPFGNQMEQRKRQISASLENIDK